MELQSKQGVPDMGKGAKAKEKTLPIACVS